MNPLLIIYLHALMLAEQDVETLVYASRIDGAVLPKTEAIRQESKMADEHIECNGSVSD